MRIELDVGVVSRDFAPALIQDLSLLVPEAVWQNQRGLNIRLSATDSRAGAALDVFRRFSCQPWLDSGRAARKPCEYSIRLDRRYSKRDYDSCEFLALEPKSYSEGLHRNSEGLIQLDVRKLKRKADFAKATPEWIVVSSRVKRLIEESPLKGVSFRPTILEDCDRSPPRPVEWSRLACEPFWEIYSERVLPPMAPWNDLRDRQCKDRVGPDHLGGYFLKEGVYLTPEPHYRCSDTTSLPECDLWGTYETFGSSNPNDRMKIASKRFYHFCRAHELKVSWTPVRLDPDSGPEGGPLPHYPPELREFLTPPA